MSWGRGFDIAAESGYLGTGYNLIGSFMYRIVNDSLNNDTMYGNDSSILVVFMTTGFVGIVLFALHIIYLLLKPTRSKEVKSLLFAALVICNFNNLLFYTMWIFPFYSVFYLVVLKEDKCLQKSDYGKMSMQLKKIAN